MSVMLLGNIDHKLVLPPFQNECRLRFLHTY